MLFLAIGGSQKAQNKQFLTLIVPSNETDHHRGLLLSGTIFASKGNFESVIILFLSLLLPDKGNTWNLGASAWKKQLKYLTCLSFVLEKTTGRRCHFDASAEEPGNIS